MENFLTHRSQKTQFKPVYSEALGKLNSFLCVSEYFYLNFDMAYAVGMRWKVPRLGTSVAGRLLSATRIKSEIPKVKLFVSERTYNKEAQLPIRDAI